MTTYILGMPCWKKIRLLKHNVAAILNRNGHPKGFLNLAKAHAEHMCREPAITCQICHKTLATREEIFEKEVFAHVGNGSTKHYCVECESGLWL